MGETAVNSGEATSAPGWAPWVIRGGAAAALALSGVLLYESLIHGGLPGCGAGSDCDTVLSSRWSKVMGVPVAAPAIVVYAVMLAASLHIGPAASEARRRVAWRVLLFCAALAGAAAAWFFGVQVFELGVFCRYCSATHGIGLVTAIVAWESAPVTRRAAMVLGASGLVAVGGLAAAQTWGPYEAHDVVPSLGGPGYYDTGPGPERKVGLLEGAVTVLPHQFPIIGSPDAPLVVAELMDYTCPHCRELNHKLKGVRTKLENRLSVIPLPMPLDADCNPLVKPELQNPLHATACELAELALAVYRANDGWFEAYHEWLMDGESAPTPEAARQRAVELVGAEALDGALADPWIAERIQINIKVYQLTPKSLPILLLPTSVAVGQPGTETELLTLLRAEMTAVESATIRLSE